MRIKTGYPNLLHSHDLLCLIWWLEPGTLLHFSIQAEVKPEPIMSRMYRRSTASLQSNSLNSFSGLSVFLKFAISKSDYQIGFALTTSNRRLYWASVSKPDLNNGQSQQNQTTQWTNKNAKQ